MISLMLKGFLILFIAFLIGLPIGDLMARQLRRWLRRPRPKNERVLTMIAGAMPAQPPSSPREPTPPLTYPVSVFGHTTTSTSVRRDGMNATAPPTEPFISP